MAVPRLTNTNYTADLLRVGAAERGAKVYAAGTCVCGGGGLPGDNQSPSFVTAAAAVKPFGGHVRQTRVRGAENVQT